MRKLFILILAVLTMGIAYSQEGMLSRKSYQQRKELVSALPLSPVKEYALEYARQYNLPARIEYEDGSIREIHKIPSDGTPLYYKTMNLNAAKTVSTNRVWEGGDLGLELSGEGIVIGVWDGGSIRISHQEFGGRARRIDTDNNVVDHATHVAGTVGAAGIARAAKGMAYKSSIEGYDWNNDNAEMRSAAEQGLLISNHSYGFIHGWERNPEEDRWEWWGAETLSDQEDYKFGLYRSEAREWDEIAYDFPYYLIVKSAGNDRGEGPPPGTPHYIFSGGDWVESTTNRPKDGWEGGYDCIGTQSTAKNILTVGAIDDIPDGYQDAADSRLASFSVFGPTDDGRIKPDIVGNGINLTSSGANADNDYSNQSGTSSSSPNVAGSLALLQQHYHDLNGSFMHASTLKALVLHTADDASNPGPDYKVGWGVMNTSRAAGVISDGVNNAIIYDTLVNLEKSRISLFGNGDQPVKITLVWTDPAGKAIEFQLDPTTRNLVNDLDIRLVRIIDSLEFEPFVLDPVNPDLVAVPGDNQVDNVEQILIDNPLKGFYELVITHKSELTGGAQPFSLVLSGINKVYIADGFTEKTRNNGEIMLSSAETYVNNMDAQWLINPDNQQPISLYFDFFDTESDFDLISVYDGESDTAPLLAQFSDSLPYPDTIVNSSSGEMYITFVSNDSVTGRGFLGKYCTTAPEGSYDIIGESFPCEYSVESFYAFGPEGASYSWDSDQSWDLNLRSTNGVDVQVGGSLDTLRLTPFNRCGVGTGSNLGIIPVKHIPEIRLMEGDTVPCAGVTSSLVVNDEPGVTYDWILPPGWAGYSNTHSLQYQPAFGDANIRVTGTNACGKGPQLNIALNVLDRPELVSILTDKSPPCEFSTQAFYVNPDPGHTYHWSVGDGWEIAGDTVSDTVLVKVGQSSTFMNVTSRNKCGERNSTRLFLTAPVPPSPVLEVSTNSFGYPVINLINNNEYFSLTWYIDGEPLRGNALGLPFLTANRNGIYTVEGVNDRECSNISDEGIRVDNELFNYLAYRINETTIVVETSVSGDAGFNIVSLTGRVVHAGTLSPGYNEIPFRGSGLFLIHIEQEGGGQNSLKVYL